jgi:hypothetical protein
VSEPCCPAVPFHLDDIEGSVCHCPCHRNRGMTHCMPCCYVCPHCRRNITTYGYERHVEKCKDSRDAGTWAKTNEKQEEPGA